MRQSMPKPAHSRRQVLAGLGVAGGISAMGTGGAQAATRADPRDLSSADRKRLLANFAFNAEIWWPDLSFEKRIAKAAEAGFSSIEMWNMAPPDRDAAAIGKLCKSLGVKMEQATAAMSWRILAEGYKDTYLAETDATLELAHALGADKICFVGHQVVEGMSKDDMLKRYQEYLALAAPKWEKAGVTAIVEPFNPYNHPGHFLYGSHDAVPLVREIGSLRIKLNWDLFHMQRSEGNVVDAFRKGADQVAYVQLADSPDRKQPGTGEMNYAYILREVRRAGYKGVFGLECWPINDDTEKALHDVIALAEAFTA